MIPESQERSLDASKDPSASSTASAKARPDPPRLAVIAAATPLQNRKPLLRHHRSPSNPVDYTAKNVWNIASREREREKALAKEPSQPAATHRTRRPVRNSDMAQEHLVSAWHHDKRSAFPSAALITTLKRQAQAQLDGSLPRNKPGCRLPLHAPKTHTKSPLGAASFCADELLLPLPLPEESPFYTETESESVSRLQEKTVPGSVSLAEEAFASMTLCNEPALQQSPEHVSCRPRSNSITARNPLGSYQLMLVKELGTAACSNGGLSTSAFAGDQNNGSALPSRSLRFPLLAELTVSPVVSGTKGSSADFSSTRRYSFAFEAAYLEPADGYAYTATGLGRGHIRPDASEHILQRYADHFVRRLPNDCTDNDSVIFSRNSLVQLMVRNPQDGCVADIFVLRLELADMPPNTRTIIRQKAYRAPAASEGNAATHGYLAKLIEVPLVRSFDPVAQRQRIKLAGPIAVAFSFNRSNARIKATPSLLRRREVEGVEAPQKTHTVLEFPCDGKYFSLHGDLFRRPSDAHPSTHSHSHPSPPHAAVFPADSSRPRANRTMSLQIGPSGSAAVPRSPGSPKRTFQHGSLCL